jgi:hypothetical protein
MNEWVRIQKHNEESDTVRIEPLGWNGSGAPEKYRVTFHCKGIASIDAAQNPVYADLHTVHMECHTGFPMDPPVLRWETAIWHPNVQHKEPKGVCVNKPEWLGGQTIVDLCQMMFEMVQYRNYNAGTIERPYGMDHTVAKWVREVGEPRGIMNKAAGKSVDNKPFTRPVRRIQVLPKAPPPPPPASRVRLLKPTA